MTTTNGKTREDYQAELAVLGDLLMDPAESPAVKTPFVPCADLLLVQARDDAEIKAFYDQYFERKHHRFLTGAEAARLLCSSLGDADDPIGPWIFAGHGCLPPSCTSLGGLRGSAL